MAAEDNMFQEVMTCMDRGDRARAKDLLTRLLKTNQDNPQYWLWMSAVVDTNKERVYCLKEAYRRDPNSQAARMGLILAGAAPTSEQAQPAPFYRRDWQASLAGMSGAEISGLAGRKQWIWMGAGVLLLAALVFFGLFGTKWLASSGANRLAQAPVVMATLTLPPSSTPAATPVPGRQTGPTPLWMLLPATYTPTPVYVNTPHPMSESYRLVLRAYNRADWSGMLPLLDQVATLEPDAPDLYYYYGESYRLQGDAERAQAAYEQALDLSPNFAPARLGLARLLMDKTAGFSAQAEEQLQQALEVDPGLADARLTLADLYLRAEDPERALAILDQPDPALNASPLYFYARARAYFAAGDLTSALEDANQVKTLDLTYLPAYRLRGEILQQQGDVPAAVDELETYLVYQPLDAEALVWLAKAHLEQGEREEAVELLSQAMEGGQNGVDLYLQRAEIYLALEDPDAALKDYESALWLDKNSFAANLGKGQALMGMGYNGDAYIQFNRSEGLAQTDRQMASLRYWRALALEELIAKDSNSAAAAVLDWTALLELPEDSYPPEWAVTAEAHLQQLYTATPTLKPSQTATPTRTPVPSATSRTKTATAGAPIATPDD